MGNCILTDKEHQLMLVLAKTKEAVSGKILAAKLGISTKTVQRYVKSINQAVKDFSIEIAGVRGTGYCLRGDGVAIRQCLHEYFNTACQRRLKDIAVCLVAKEFLTIEEIAEKMSYSPSMINKLLPIVKSYLALFDLKIHAKPHYGLYVCGKESDIRNMLLQCAFIRLPTGEVDCFLPSISKEEWSCIKYFVIDFFRSYSNLVSDADLADLIARLAVIVSRCRQNKFCDCVNNFANSKILQILNEVSQRLSITIPPSEICYLSMYEDIFSQKSSVWDNKESDEISSFVEKAYKIMRKEYPHLEIDTETRLLLCMHVKLMLSRLKHKHTAKNYLLQEIKASHTLEMSYAITFVQMLEKQFDVFVPEDELGYLAIYFAMRKNSQKRAKRVIILCNYGIGTSQMIKERICEEFPKLDVIGVYPMYYAEVITKQEVDLIISTAPLNQYNVTKPYLVVENILGDDAFDEIRKRIKNQLECDVLTKYVRKNSFLRFGASSKTEVLEHMAEQMIKNKSLSSAVANGVYEREQISSTDIGNLVAVPHTLLINQEKSNICIGILDKPISWGKEKAQLIFLIALRQEDVRDGEVFKYLYRVTKDFAVVNKLIECLDLSSFITCLQQFDYGRK